MLAHRSVCKNRCLQKPVSPAQIHAGIRYQNMMQRPGVSFVLRLLQASSQTPIWLPVSLLSSNETASVPHQHGNSSLGIRESRWLEIFPVWEEQHRVRAGSDEMCLEEAGDNGVSCGRPVASPPVVSDSAADIPWLMKGHPGVFLSSVADGAAGRVSNYLQCAICSCCFEGMNCSELECLGFDFCVLYSTKTCVTVTLNVLDTQRNTIES